jgi:hypothetical protein
MRNRLLSVILLAATAGVCGCVTKGEAEARSRAAFLAGQQQAVMRQSTATNPTVFLAGPVRFPTLPWTADLTLAQAIVAADYRGADPKVIIINRGGQAITIEPQRLLEGEDIPLVAGDSIDIR